MSSFKLDTDKQLFWIESVKRPSMVFAVYEDKKWNGSKVGLFEKAEVANHMKFYFYDNMIISCSAEKAVQYNSEKNLLELWTIDKTKKNKKQLWNYSGSIITSQFDGKAITLHHKCDLKLKTQTNMLEQKFDLVETEKSKVDSVFSFFRDFGRAVIGKSGEKKITKKTQKKNKSTSEHEKNTNLFIKSVMMDKVLCVKKNCQVNLSDMNLTPEKEWSLSNGYIMNVKTNLYLDISSEYKLIVDKKNHNRKTQKWIYDNKSKRLYNWGNNLSINIANNKRDVNLVNFSISMNQQWELLLANESTMKEQEKKMEKKMVEEKNWKSGIVYPEIPLEFNALSDFKVPKNDLRLEVDLNIPSNDLNKEVEEGEKKENEEEPDAPEFEGMYAI